KTYESQVQITSYLANNGFFDASVSTEVEKKRRKAYVTYQVVENEPYIIDSLFQKTPDDQINQILMVSRGSLIKVGSRYNQGILTKERQRVEDLLKDHVYYNFFSSFIVYCVYEATITLTVGIEQLVRRPGDGENPRRYTREEIQLTIEAT